jgi:hypothetical protein
MIKDARSLGGAKFRAEMSSAFSFAALLVRGNVDLRVTFGSRAVQGVTIRFFLLAALVVWLLLVPTGTAAQGCAMCYQNASASGAQGGTALRHGILILLVPAITIFVSIFVWIYRRRHVVR